LAKRGSKDTEGSGDEGTIESAIVKEKIYWSLPIVKLAMPISSCRALALTGSRLSGLKISTKSAIVNRQCFQNWPMSQYI
jgi:hypothetical protein